MIRLCISTLIFILFCASPPWLSSVGRCEDNTQSSTDDTTTNLFSVEAIQSRIKNHIRETPELEGAWIHASRDTTNLDSSENKQVAFSHRTTADGRSARQKELLTSFIKTIIPTGQFRIDTKTDKQLPYDRLKEHIEKLIQHDFRFPGCKLIALEYFVNQDDGLLYLRPKFQVARDGQFIALTTECRDFMRQSGGWNDVTVYASGDDQKILVPEPTEPTRQEMFRIVQDAKDKNPLLDGAWLNVRVDDQGAPEVAPLIYIFTRGLDRTTRNEQEQAMLKIVKAAVPSGRFRFEEEKDHLLPFSELISELQQTLDYDALFKGCVLSRATYKYNEDDGSFNLVLHGRIWNVDQADLISNLCRKKMHEHPEWESAGVQLHTRSDRLVVVSESPIQGTFYFTQAMHHFWKGNYDTADDLLALASLEDPNNVVYRYFRVIGEFAQGRNREAERRLTSTMIGFNIQLYNQDYIDILHAIERIQGPLRYRLMAAEKRIMVHVSEGLIRTKQ